MDATVNLTASFEAQVLGVDAGASSVPGVLVTGTLGSGKTSLVRELLRNRSNLRFSVVINELAATDVGSDLAGASSTHAVLGLPAALSVTGGCACCRGDQALRDAVRKVLATSCHALIVETTGAADPAPVASLLQTCGACSPVSSPTRALGVSS
jgi:G3E family GTPase